MSEAKRSQEILIIKIGPDSQKHFAQIADEMVAAIGRDGGVCVESNGDAAAVKLISAITATRMRFQGYLEFDFQWLPTMPQEIWGIRVFISRR